MRALLALTAGVSGAWLIFKKDSRVVESPSNQLLPRSTGRLRFNSHYITREVKTIGVIGGGRAGVITAKTLAEQGYLVEVLELKPNFEGEGRHIARQRLPGLCHSLPDFTFFYASEAHKLPELSSASSLSRVPTAADISSFYDAYLQRFNLRPLVQYGTAVSQIAQETDGTWAVSTSKGTKKYDFVVLATGLNSVQRVPNVPGLGSFQGDVLYTDEFFASDDETVMDKQVVVIGSNADSLEAVLKASPKAHSVTHLLHRSLWLQKLPWWVQYSKAGAVFQPSAYPESVWHSLLTPARQLYNFLHSLASKPVPRPDMSKASFTARFDCRPMLGLHDAYLSTKAKSLRSKFLVKANGIDTETGFIPADLIVLATGYRPQTFMLPAEQDGMWLYRSIVYPGVANLAVVGLTNTPYHGLVTNLQAVWLAEALRGRVLLPSVVDMKQDCITRRDHARKQGGPLLSYSWSSQHLLAQLLKDMAIRTNRRESVWDDWTKVLLAEDYESVLTHRV
jgi:thioredoxin reductase